MGGEAPSGGRLWTAASGGLERLPWTCRRQSSLLSLSTLQGRCALGLTLGSTSDARGIPVFQALSPGSSGATESLEARLL